MWLAGLLGLVDQQFTVQDFGEVRGIEIFEIFVQVGDRSVGTNEYAGNVIVVIA